MREHWAWLPLLQEEFGMITKQAKLKKQAYASTLKSRALSVLIYLIDRSNKELTCFPSISTMAEQLHISVSTVKRALHELEDSGYIIRDFRFRENNKGQTSNLYTLVLFECPPASEERDEVKTEEHDECIKKMGVGTVDALQENKAEQQEYQIDHISFYMIKAQKEENKVHQEEILLQEVQINDHQEKATNRQWWRTFYLLFPPITSHIPDQHMGWGLLRESGTGTIILYPWTGEGVSLMPP